MVKKKCIFCNKPIKDFKVWEDTTTRKIKVFILVQ